MNMASWALMPAGWCLASGGVAALQPRAGHAQRLTSTGEDCLQNTATDWKRIRGCNTEETLWFRDYTALEVAQRGIPDARRP